ncbi:hypothetical protein CHCC14820_0670 [Bacillus paralicheniformis]|nr:hypothetical protein B4123_2695 [Bacillus paralicheniformis]TWJ36360.1 hypothetical protein CHCC5027_1101 [Bacillus paralicheniformis]TWJ50103.1 hypothetical protein CHCC5023_2149 [Bacillus paralicheniformis]TWJ57545.1 hypothetical protein CHCC5021_2292 [Bacillus paralicheniformis]TWJ63974.1 hypothetical protein CHCC5022_0104 [Bacillus paralicheniformis]
MIKGARKFFFHMRNLNFEPLKPSKRTGKILKKGDMID